MVLGLGGMGWLLQVEVYHKKGGMTKMTGCYDHTEVQRKIRGKMTRLHTPMTILRGILHCHHVLDA